MNERSRLRLQGETILTFFQRNASFIAVFTLLLCAPAPALTQGNMWSAGSSIAAANTSSFAANDGVLLEMERAFSRGQSARLTQLLPAAAGHPLQAYAEYWELKARLENASNAEIQAFLQRWQGSYVQDRMRNDWLLLLGKNGDTLTFAQEYPQFRMRDDATVRCWAAAFGRQNDTSIFNADWLAMRGGNKACEAGAAHLLADGKLSPIAILRKARNLAEAGQDGGLNNTLALLPGNTPAGEALLQNIVRIAAKNPDDAARQLQNTAGLNEEQRSWGWGVVGKQAAMNLSNLAPHYYAQAASVQDWSDDMLAWRVRADLRTGIAATRLDILQTIAAMPAKMQQDPTWQYWKARALATSGNKAEIEQAQKIYLAIASPHGFYEILATEELGKSIALPPDPPRPSTEELARVRANPGFARSLYAIGLGIRSMGGREWNYTAHLHENGGLPPRELLAAAELACQREFWDRCINTAERNPLFAAWQRYPMPHKAEVLGNSQRYGADAAYVYGLIRQESRFVTVARSGVGASGLMQIMPATARWTAKKIGMNGFTPDQVYDSHTNVVLGVNYLNLALESFQNSKPLAAAAYNAGPGRPKRWRELGGTVEGAIWAENVPFNETRDYVKKVLANTTAYAALITGKPQSLKAELGQVGPAPSVVANGEELP
jgi:soluble lytic murein transglycosylase